LALTYLSRQSFIRLDAGGFNVQKEMSDDPGYEGQTTYDHNCYLKPAMPVIHHVSTNKTCDFQK
jgi:hypothetical protein